MNKKQERIIKLDKKLWVKYLDDKKKNIYGKQHFKLDFATSENGFNDKVCNRIYIDYDCDNEELFKKLQKRLEDKKTPNDKLSMIIGWYLWNSKNFNIFYWLDKELSQHLIDWYWGINEKYSKENNLYFWNINEGDE